MQVFFVFFENKIVGGVYIANNEHYENSSILNYYNLCADNS